LKESPKKIIKKVEEKELRHPYRSVVAESCQKALYQVFTKYQTHSKEKGGIYYSALLKRGYLVNRFLTGFCHQTLRKKDKDFFH